MGIYLGQGIYSKEARQKIKQMSETFKINDSLEINREHMLFITFTENIFSNFETFYGKFFLFSDQQNKDETITQQFEPHSISFKLFYPESSMGDAYQEREYTLHIYKSTKNPQYVSKSYPEYGIDDEIQSHILYEFWQVPDYAYKLLSKTIRQYSYKEQQYDSLIKKIQEEILEVEQPSDMISETKNQIPENYNFIIPSGIPVIQQLEWIRKRQFPNKDKYNLPIYFINNGKLYFKFINDYETKKDIHLGTKLSYTKNFANLEDYEDKTKELTTSEDFLYINKNRTTVLNQSISRNLKSLIEGKGDSPVKRIQIEFMNSFLPEPLYQEQWKDIYKDWYQFDQQFLDDPLLLEDRAGYIYSTQMLGILQNQDSITFDTNNLSSIKILEDINIATVITLNISDQQFTGANEEKDITVKVQQVVDSRTHVIFPQQQLWQIYITTILDSKFVNLNNQLYKLSNVIEDQNKQESVNQADKFGETSDAI